MDFQAIHNEAQTAATNAQTLSLAHTAKWLTVVLLGLMFT